MAVSVKKYADSLVPGGALTDVSEQQLITLITEIEKNILPLFDINAELTKAIERRNAEDFQQAYNNIFGDGENQGELAAKING
jgi:flagellar biosynthesis/type III secretory pathway protein FliH